MDLPEAIIILRAGESESSITSLDARIKGMRTRTRSIYLVQYIAFAGVMGFLMPSAPHAQENSAKQSDKEMGVRVARVLNVRSGSYIKSAAIWVEGERIKAVGREIDVLKEAPASVQILDLGDVTVLPGLIDRRRLSPSEMS